MQVDRIPMSLVIEFVVAEVEIGIVARRRNSFVVVRVVVELGIDGSEDDLDGLEGCKVQKGCILHPDELELDKGGDVEVKDKLGRNYERVKLDYDLRKKYGSKSLWKEFVRVDEKNGIVREEGGRRFDEKQKKKLRRGVVVVVVERSCKGSRPSESS